MSVEIGSAAQKVETDFVLLIRLSSIRAYRDIFFLHLSLFLIGSFFLHHGVRWNTVDDVNEKEKRLPWSMMRSF
jgi:hypothetical protein